MDDEVFGEPYGNGEDITLMEAVVQMKRKSLEYFLSFFDLRGWDSRGAKSFHSRTIGRGKGKYEAAYTCLLLN